MIHRVATRAQKIQRAIEAISRMSEGTVIQWPWIREVTGVESVEQARQLMPSIQAQLQARHGIFLESLRAVGYVLKPVDQQADLVEHRFHRASKRMKRIAASGSFVRVANIADEQKRNDAINRINRMASLAFMVEKGAAGITNRDGNISALAS